MKKNPKKRKTSPYEFVHFYSAPRLVMGKKRGIWGALCANAG
jgi:hypothetical protein